MMIPVHAMGTPDSFRWRICFNEVVPNVSARIPRVKLVGKQMIPVNGMGSQPVQKDRNVKIPKTRLRTDFVLMEEGRVSVSRFISVDTIKVKIKPSW